MREKKNPYKFLDAYTVEDASIFFGRERETRVLLSDVLVNRLVVLFARSGTGKTSLINAGVRPHLEQQGYGTFFVRVHGDPAESARAMIVEQFGPTVLQGDGLADQLENFVKSRGQPIVLFFDQFEEFFIYTLKPNPAKGREFIADVARLYRNRDAGVHLVFSMREEFFVEMDVFRDEIPAIFHNDSNLRLRPFDRSQARDAIVHPARVFQTHVKADLVERLLDDLDGETDGGRRKDSDVAIEPAQLQIVCDTLWERREDNEIRLDHYHALGQGRGGNIARQVLYDRLEQGFQEINSRDQLALLDRLLPELRTKEGTKYVRDIEGLVKTLSTVDRPIEETALRELLTLLDRMRFIHHGKRDTLEVVELTHDYLVGHLDALRERVQLIWPRKKLKEALTRHEMSRVYATSEELENIAAEVYKLALTPSQAEFLFQSGLEHGYRTELWFRVAQVHGVRVWDILEKLIADAGGPLARLSRVIDLCEQIARDKGSTTDSAVALNLLKKALERDDLTMETQETLARLTGVWTPWVAAAATKQLLAFLSLAVAEGRIASSAIAALGRLELPQSVELLTRALERDALILEAQAALLPLTGAQNPRLASHATDVLCDFLQANVERRGRVLPSAIRWLGRIETSVSVDLLVKALHMEELSSEAKLALERLAASEKVKVAAAARETLARGFQSGTAQAINPYRSTNLGEQNDRLRSRGTSLRNAIGHAMMAKFSQWVRSGECVLFLGAGVHAPPPADLTQAYPEQKRPPSTGALSQRLAELIQFENQLPNDSPRDFRRVTQLFEKISGLSRRALIDEIDRALNEGKSPSPMLLALARLPFSIIITTNFDQLFEQALIAAGKKPIVIKYDPISSSSSPDPDDASEEKPILVKLYGDLSERNSPVLTEDDFLQFIFRMMEAGPHQPLPVQVRHQLSKWPTLFLGFSLRDFENRFIFRSLSQGDDPATTPLRFVLDLQPDPLVVRSWEHERRFATFITQDLWSFVPELYRAVTGSELADIRPA